MGQDQTYSIHAESVNHNKSVSFTSSSSSLYNVFFIMRKMSCNYSHLEEVTAFFVLLAARQSGVRMHGESLHWAMLPPSLGIKQRITLLGVTLAPPSTCKTTDRLPALATNWSVLATGSRLTTGRSHPITWDHFAVNFNASTAKLVRG